MERFTMPSVIWITVYRAWVCFDAFWTGYLLDLAACNRVVKRVLDVMMLLREVADPLTNLI